VAPDVVITAFHVVGSCLSQRWSHEDSAGVTYHLSPRGPGLAPIPLTPQLFDAQADLALFRCASERPQDLKVLLLTDAPVAKSWLAEGYPGFHGGEPMTLSGEVVAIRGERLASAPGVTGV
jgi:hypothetical protein